MKKTLALFLIFIVFVTGYFYYSKPQAIQFKTVSDLRLAKVTEDASELRGDIIFHNPNKMRSQLGKVNFEVILNGSVIGKISDNFATAIKGDEDFHYSFQVRFPKADVLKEDTAKSELPVKVNGTAGSDVLFANYTFAIDYTGTVKNTAQ